MSTIESHSHERIGNIAHNSVDQVEFGAGDPKADPDVEQAAVDATKRVLAQLAGAER